MRQWLANRKNIPAGLPMECTDSPDELKLPVDVTERVGAPAALDRLQRAEVAAFERLTKAQASRKPDPVMIKSYRQEWLRLLEALRHFERAVSADKRDLGELIERSQVEKDIALLGQAARQIFEGMLPRLAGDILNCDQIRCRQLLRRANWYTHIGSLSVGYVGQLPEWLLKAYVSDLQGALTHGDTMHADAKKVAGLLGEFGLALGQATVRDTPPVPPGVSKT